MNNCQRGGIRLEVVEDAVVRFYATFQPSQPYLVELQAEIIAEFQAQRRDTRLNAERARRRRTGLLDERAKLLQAHYAAAVPVDLLRSEMERLTRALADVDRTVQTAEASTAAIEKTLQPAMIVAGDCHRQYQVAPPAIRRKINQGFFTRLWLARDGTVERYELTEPFRQVLYRQLSRALDDGQETHRAAPTPPGTTPSRKMISSGRCE